MKFSSLICNRFSNENNNIPGIQPSWRHVPHLSDRHMIAYKQSDVKFSWIANETVNNFPKVCGYVKEGAGKPRKKIFLIKSKHINKKLLDDVSRIRP